MNVFQTVGGIDIDLWEGCVRIQQEDILGGESDCILIPLPLVELVLDAITAVADEDVE